VRVALGQFNATVGDLAGNAERMRNIYAQALKGGVDLLAFPEMAVCGYPPEDLLLKKHFIEDACAAVEKLAADCPDATMIVGFAESYQGKTYNSAGVLRKGRIEKIYRKGLLPNYGVFYERRYFEPGTEPLIIEIKNQKSKMWRALLSLSAKTSGISIGWGAFSRMSAQFS
jgi:predicted amidohydrolase